MYRNNKDGNSLPINLNNTERVISLVSGSLLLVNSITRNKKVSIPKIILSAMLLYRGSTGYCPASEMLGKKPIRKNVRNINIRASAIVYKSREKIYNFWRQLSNLPYFMEHLEYVQVLDENRSKWKVKGPAGLPLIWNAYIVKDIPGELIGWSSLPGSDIETSGKVQFLDAGKYATEVRVNISYRPSEGVLSSGIAKLFNNKFKKLLKNDIMNFKNYIEAGN
ncbi:MAG: SRPBCC family protein [Ferruginibacter sp.]